MQPPSIAGLEIADLEKLLTPLPRFRAAQIYKWITCGVTDFNQMTDLPGQLRKELTEKFCLYSSFVDNILNDTDVKKIVITHKDGAKTEAVLLNDGKKRYTACLSSQVGCPAECIFCKTGKHFTRNLNNKEIIEQFLFLRNSVTDETAGHIIDNIVIMGMGEPLLNLPQLTKALSFFTSKTGLNFSRRRITVSTCGIYDGIKELANNGPLVRLAFSLVTADEQLRQKLMPVNNANPLNKIKEALTLYQRRSGNRITLEIPLLGGINCRDKDAALAADFAAGLDTVINVIPWNPVPDLYFEGIPLREPEKKETENFIHLLEKNGL